jgi:NAD(P)-dependent dehydrogenase (short-subunit alcohol dehydrogenase family)
MPTIIVTGAAGVIGASVAKRLAARGTRLILTDVGEQSLLDLAALIRATPETTDAELALVTGDLVDPTFAQHLVDLASAGGEELLGCVNAAGVENPVVRATELAIDDMRSSFEVNVFALTRMCQAVIRDLVARQASGRIVNLASGAALSGASFMTAYNSSKHAVLGVTRCLAKEFAASRIAVNAVCPGYVESRMVGGILSRLEDIAGRPFDAIATIPAGRMADPDEVGNVVEYLMLDAPVYLTGTALLVDGGLYA